jgi:hypothetical protein
VNERAQYLFRVKVEPGLDPYLRADPRATAAHRARLRLDRALLQTRLCEMKLAGDSMCRKCDGFMAVETVEHVLLRCEFFNQERQKLRDCLSQHGIDLTCALILGTWPTPLSKNCEVMRALRIFLHFVQNALQF